MSPRYSGYIPNSSLSPSIQSQANFNSLDFSSTGTSDFGQNPEKSYSPVGLQQKYSQYNYVGYQQNYPQKSPYTLHTPDTSPTHSPEPKTVVKQPKSPQESKENSEEGTVLPTPELSPLEQEQFAEEKRLSNIQHTSNLNSNNNLSPTQQNYTSRVQNYRQPSTANYTNTQPITSVPMANGMYVIGANKSSVEQGHVVTGTFYPPVATSQDQQMLGTAQTNLNAMPNSAVQYYTNMQFYPKEYYKESIQIMNDQESKDNFMAYNQNLKSDMIMEKQEYDLNYKSMNEQYHAYSTGSPLVQNFITEERSDVDSDVDAREFDKYLKFPSDNIIDSNHNYHRNDSVSYNFQPQHTSVILPNTNVKPEPAPPGHYPEVYNEASQNGLQKTDDDFSEILADVRKTCYSNWCLFTFPNSYFISFFFFFSAIKATEKGQYVQTVVVRAWNETINVWRHHTDKPGNIPLKFKQIRS